MVVEPKHEALQVGLRVLRDESGNIANALYRLYAHYRLKFIEERGLMDSPPGGGQAWVEALADARVLEHYVCQQWAEAIYAAVQPT